MQVGRGGSLVVHSPLKREITECILQPYGMGIVIDGV